MAEVRTDWPDYHRRGGSFARSTINGSWSPFVLRGEGTAELLSLDAIKLNLGSIRQALAVAHLMFVSCLRVKVLFLTVLDRSTDPAEPTIRGTAGRPGFEEDLTMMTHQ